MATARGEVEDSEGRCHGLSLPACRVYQRALLRMRDLLTYHGGLSLPGLFMFICEIIFVYTRYLFIYVLQLLWPDIQTQKGNHDCGLFAIANAFALCCGERPEEFAWDQGGNAATSGSLSKCREIVNVPSC